MLRGEIEESEKAGSRQEVNPGHLACAANALSLSSERQPDNHQPSQSSIRTAQVVLKCLSRTSGSDSVCAVRTLLGVDHTQARYPLGADHHKPGVLGLIPGDCQPFRFPLFSPLNI